MLQQRKITIITTTMAIMVGSALLWSAEPASGGKMEGCMTMMKERQQMMSEMKSQNAELQALTTQLKSASEQKKVDLLAQVVTKLVDQRVKGSEKMEAMHERMMQHMSQHAGQGEQSMAQCPMMQGTHAMGGSEAQHESEHGKADSDTQ